MPENNHPFCNLHSDLMRCLGKLEQGQEYMNETIIGINLKLDSVIAKIEAAKIVNNIDRTQTAVEHAKDIAKTNILYWVLGIAGGGLILSIVNRFVPVILK
jgi:hypothetical protein